MATLALAAAGAAVGGAVLPAGIGVFGATISGAAIGSQVGALAGSFIDQSLFGASGEPRVVEGPRLRELHGSASSEGAPIPRVYGRARLGGQIIWATDFEEETIRRTQTNSGGGGGGKGGSSGGSQTTSESVEYRYYANFAVAICEGEIGGIGRVWADGRQINLSRITHRIYRGSEDQAQDSLIVSRQGSSKTPAYRGVAYIVFERMPLADYGNRMPQLSFEVYRPVDNFAEAIKGVVLIPGSGEFVYATDQVTQILGSGTSIAENIHTQQGGTDWTVAIDQLEETLPNADAVSLIVSWFGTDLRAGNCQILPGVEIPVKETDPQAWSVAGVDRANAHLVSEREGRPAYGGTPSDASVIAAINDLTARGKQVTLTPFILMDVPEGNTLPNPYGGSTQPPYPWRGRITCNPAPGEPGSPDKTSAAATQLQTFIGTAQPSDFSVSGSTVTYSGPNEWTYRRMVLHQAHLAKAAGGVSAFLIGTELRGLTWVRDSASTYPFVDALKDLADDVKSVLGSGTAVTYAADWSEYFGHQPADGTGDVYFHLDPLWAHTSIDAIGIDCYWPLSDWRDGRAHLDYAAGFRSIYDLDYLKSNVQGAEGYDWYYASQSDRDAQIRTPISDGSGKPWVFRYKDIKSWWSNQHYNRPGGIEAATPTGWTPMSKPFWMMEIGCPAADKGTNQPNVFVDPKSSENALPYYSNGSRDDMIQRRHLQAFIESFDPSHPDYVADTNPTSGIYSGLMVDLSKIFVYCWDARPYPAFPYNLDVWGDGENWRLGHWLTGRFANAPLAETVAAILSDFGFEDHAAGGLNGTIPGFVIDRLMSPREALQPLGLAYFFDIVESGGRIVFRHRGAESPAAVLNEDALVETDPDEALLTLTRGQETELPASAKLTYISTGDDYKQAVAEARRLVGASGHVARAELPIVLEAEQAAQIAQSWLFEAWSGRERAKLALPPSQLAVEPGDVIELDRPTGVRELRVIEVADGGARTVEALSIDRDVYDAAPAPERLPTGSTDVFVGQPRVESLDLPLLRGDAPEAAGYIAAFQNPWPGSVAVYGSPEDAGFSLRALARGPAVIGQTLDDLPPGPTSRLDRATRVQVSVGSAQLQSVEMSLLLQGANLAAIENTSGNWEVLQFETATLISSGVYELAGLLRGQAGSEPAMAAAGSVVTAGATIVMLDGALAQVNLTADEIGLPYQWRYGPATRDIGDSTYGEMQHAFQGVGLRPLSPVHVRASRSGGDVELSWVRRTRSGGDSWEATEVPLFEASEAYEVDILDGTEVKRTLSATMPTATYTHADQVADFGSPQSTYDVAVYQLSAVWGRGAPGQATV